MLRGWYKQPAEIAVSVLHHVVWNPAAMPKPKLRENAL